jgi:hypothetical protein
MRFASFACATLASVLASAASAHVLIQVDKTAQQMSVLVDGMPRYRFAVSTGRAGYGTPSGTFHPERMELTWFSKEYYNSPMPHSIFFHGGFAIHGSYEINQLGGPASHGCIRLHPDNAAVLYALVQQQGMGATTIVVSGQSPESRPPAEGSYQYYPGSPYLGQRVPPYYQPSPYYQLAPYRQSPGWIYQPRGNY